MRLLLLVAAIVSVALDPGIAQQAAPRGRLYRGPLVTSRPAELVVAERALPLDFQNGQFYLGAVSPRTGARTARLEVDIRSNTLRAVSIRGITLRGAIGPAEHGMFTFRMRGVASIYAADELLRLRPDNIFRPAVFQIASAAELPTMLALNPASRIVFTVEHVEDDSRQPVFENPDATELLWDALGRPSLTQ